MACPDRHKHVTSPTPYESEIGIAVPVYTCIELVVERNLSGAQPSAMPPGLIIGKTRCRTSLGFVGIVLGSMKQASKYRARFCTLKRRRTTRSKQMGYDQTEEKMTLKDDHDSQ